MADLADSFGEAVGVRFGFGVEAVGGGFVVGVDKHHAHADDGLLPYKSAKVAEGAAGASRLNQPSRLVVRRKALGLVVEPIGLAGHHIVQLGDNGVR